MGIIRHFSPVFSAGYHVNTQAIPMNVYFEYPIINDTIKPQISLTL